jgi:protein gp37
MGDKSRIEWTDATWNMIRATRTIPVADGVSTTRAGWHCEHVSEGCRNCYAERMNLWRGTGREFKPASLQHDTASGGIVGDVVVGLDGEVLHQPLRWTRGRRIFVCSMTDLFASFVEDAWIDFVLAVCALAPQHTFQILTKRSDRMRRYFAEPMLPARIGARMDEIAGTTGHAPLLPLPNVWLGVSAEDQANAEQRVPDLLETMAAVRFLSAEPLLARINLRALRQPSGDVIDATYGWAKAGTMQRVYGLDLVIAGGESGARARPMHPDNVTQLRDDCAAGGTLFDLKQWGEWSPDGTFGQRAVAVERDGRTADVDAAIARLPGEVWFRMYRVGKENAGRLLGGALHDGADQLYETTQAARRAGAQADLL